MNTEFKALMHGGMYVDADLLTKGIYPTSLPHIYPKEESIEGIKSRIDQLKDITGKSFIPDSYFENLKQCELVDVIINVI